MFCGEHIGRLAPLWDYSVTLAAFSAPLCSLPPSVHENGHSATYGCQFQSSTCPLGSSCAHPSCSSGEGRSTIYQSCEHTATGSPLSSLVHSARWHTPFTATTYLVCLYYTLIIKLYGRLDKSFMKELVKPPV